MSGSKLNLVIPFIMEKKTYYIVRYHIYIPKVFSCDKYESVHASRKSAMEEVKKRVAIDPELKDILIKGTIDKKYVSVVLIELEHKDGDDYRHDYCSNVKYYKLNSNDKIIK